MPSPAARRWAGRVFALSLLVAAALRFYALTDIPYTAWVDEAYFEVRAREVLRGVNVLPIPDPVFATGNSPYHLYATALVQALGAPAPYSARRVSATMGVLGVALTFPLLRTLFRDWPETRRTVAALVGTAAHATLYASVHLSRDGNQNPGCVVWTILTLGALFLTFETRSRRWAVATGAALAVALTTYEAAYALPIIVAGYTLLRWRGGVPMKSAATLFAWTALTALVVFSPLLIYYAAYPEVVLNRFRMAQGSNPPGLADYAPGLMKVWGGLAFQGDPLIGQNLAGRPLFDPFTAALVFVGMAAALAALRRSPAAQLCLGSALIFSLPSAVTPNAPAFTRLLPMVPALCALAGWGAATLWGRAERRGPRLTQLTALMLSAGLSFATFSTARDYFGVWAGDPRLFDARQIGARRAAELALKASAGEDVFLSPRSQPLIHYTFRVLLEDTPVQVWEASPECWPYAHRRATATRYGFLPTLGFDALPLLQAAYPSGEVVDTVLHPAGYAYALFFRAPAETPAPAPAIPLSIEFQNQLWLKGLDAPEAIAPGEPLTLRLHWEVTQAGTLKRTLTGFLHLGDLASGAELIGQSDAPLCAALTPDSWRPGYRYIQTYTLPVAAAAAPGIYGLRLGVYDPELDVRLGVFGSDRPAQDNRVLVAELQVR